MVILPSSTPTSTSTTTWVEISFNPHFSSHPPTHPPTRKSIWTSSRLCLKLKIASTSTSTSTPTSTLTPFSTKPELGATSASAYLFIYSYVWYMNAQCFMGTIWSTYNSVLNCRPCWPQECSIQVTLSPTYWWSGAISAPHSAQSKTGWWRCWCLLASCPGMPSPWAACLSPVFKDMSLMCCGCTLRQWRFGIKKQWLSVRLHWNLNIS